MMTSAKDKKLLKEINRVIGRVKTRRKGGASASKTESAKSKTESAKKTDPTPERVENLLRNHFAYLRSAGVVDVEPKKQKFGMLRKIFIASIIFLLVNKASIPIINSLFHPLIESLQRHFKREDIKVKAVKEAFMYVHLFSKATIGVMAWNKATDIYTTLLAKSSKESNPEELKIAHENLVESARNLVDEKKSSSFKSILGQVNTMSND